MSFIGLLLGTGGYSNLLFEFFLDAGDSQVV
jgi:hypothetical protein